MKMLVRKRNITLSILLMMVIIYGLQGVSSAADPAVELQVETEQPLTEVELDGQSVTLKLIGHTWTNSARSIEKALTVTGIEGVSFRKGYTESYRIFVPDNPFCVGLCWGTYHTRTRRIEKVRKVDVNTVKIELAFEGDFNTDSTLIFTVTADAIVNYEGPALTAEVPVTCYKGISASTTSVLTEATLNEGVVTLTLSWGAYEADVATIRDAVMVSGINGVTIDAASVQRLSDTEITVELDFARTNLDADAMLTFSVGAGAIADYTGEELTTEIPVTAIKESVSASAIPELTEGTLDEGVVTLTLNFDAYETDITTIINAVTVTGIDGVTIDTATVQRLSDREITVGLNFARTNLDTDATLTFSVGAGAIADYTGDAFTAEILVTAVKMEISASAASPLTEATLDEGVATLTLSYDTYETDITTIINAVTVTGIDGVTIDTATVQRLSNREITVGLNFARTNLDTDATLTFSVGAGAIADYTGDAFTAEILVPAVKEISASAASPLTEATLDEGVVTLTLSYDTYEADVATIRDAVTVTGIDGVTIDTASVQRLSDREITVGLDFARTNLDTDATLTFGVGAGAIADYTGDAFTAEILVPAVKEISASAASPLTEATLDEGVVTLILSYDTYEADVATIRDAVTVTGIDGVTIDTATVQRLSDTEITVELDFDLTDFDTDTALSFSVAAGAIANYTGDDFATDISVTAIKEVISASVVSPLTEVTLDGSIVTLLITAAAFEQDIAKIRDAVTVSGINGVTIDTATVQRLNDRKITVELNFDNTDLFRDTDLIFSVAAGAIINYKGTTLTAEIPVTASRGKDLLTIFWTDYETNKIQQATVEQAIRSNLDPSDVEDLVTQGLRTPYAIALDVAGGKMYWTDLSTDKIQRANLDGSNAEDLVTQGLSVPSGIALDVAGGKMYWTDSGTDSGTDKIQRANLDGSNVQDLVTQGLRSPSGIALDVAGGKMYWTDSGTDKIQRANLDGSNIEDLVTQGLRSPSGIALDVAGGKMYWTDYATSKIQRANLDGSNIEDLVTQGLRNPSGIALDVAGGKMYWTDYATSKIQRANLDGSNIEDLVTQGLRSLSGIVIAMSSLVNPTTEKPTIAKEDVNRDGVVDVQDLAYVGLQYGKTGTNAADVNGDKVVNVDDFILVAAAVDNAAAAAPAARAQVQSHFTKAQLQGYLTEARASGNTSLTYRRGIAVVERLLALFTPEETALLANYPNPFNPETWIPYQLSKPADVTLTIYDIRGHVIRVLDLGHQRAGLYQARTRAAHWDGRNNIGEKVASGVYFYMFTAGDFTATRKMLIRK